MTESERYTIFELVANGVQLTFDNRVMRGHEDPESDVEGDFVFIVQHQISNYGAMGTDYIGNNIGEAVDALFGS